MPKPRKFFAGPWSLVADPPPCDPDNPRRALAYCELERNGLRCTCRFDLSTIAEDLEALGLGEMTFNFEDELDGDSLTELVEDLMKRVRGRTGASAERLRDELALLKQLAQEGSGLKPLDED